jgi:hypothetical protein
MKCPVDNDTLVMSERNGIEIDYCPKCRGVWLDRGELDKIIERSMAVEQTQPQQQARPKEYARSDDYRNQGRPQKKRRESFLGDLFDF